MRAEQPAAERLTYDDLNEFFWSASCVSWGPFAHDAERCVCVALRATPKTHMETRHGGWLHVFHCFQRPLFLEAALTCASCILAYCMLLSTPAWLTCLRLSLVLWLFSLYRLAKELLDAWAEAALSPPSLSPSALAAPPPASRLALAAARIAFKTSYTSAMGVLALAAASLTGCSAAGCGKSSMGIDVTADGAGGDRDERYLEEQMARAWPLWAGYITLALLQIGTYVLCSGLRASS